MGFMAVVMIGVDPHKASHTAVAVNAAEQPLGQLRVRALVLQAERLLGWAQAWPERAWAVEGAGGLGHLLAQQLLSAGERVLDVPPKLAARVRLLATGNVNKNDPNDARSVAVAALRSAEVREARRDDHAAVSHSRACHPPYDPRCSLSRAAAISCERPAGSRTGRSPAAQRRPQGVLDAAAREPIMPAAGKEGAPPVHASRLAGGRSCTALASPLDFETKR
jgi:hypothetical protein